MADDLMAQGGRPFPPPTPDTHTNVPVMHPNGDIHNIAVPFGTSIPDLHSALSDYYHEANPEPTAGGAMENQPAFRAAARNAQQKGMMTGDEQGFVYKGGGAKSANTGTTHSLQLNDIGGADATLHTHPFRTGNAGAATQTSGTPTPSQNDINLSKKAGIPFYVASKDGLYMVRPSDGAVIRVFDKMNWAEDKKK